MKTVITLETVFKRGETYGCANTSAINVDGIIPTPKGFMMSGRLIQVISVFRFIMDIGSCQALLKVKGLLADHMEK